MVICLSISSFQISSYPFFAPNDMTELNTCDIRSRSLGFSLMPWKPSSVSELSCESNQITPQKWRFARSCQFDQILTVLRIRCHLGGNPEDPLTALPLAFFHGYCTSELGQEQPQVKAAQALVFLLRLMRGSDASFLSPLFSVYAGDEPRFLSLLGSLSSTRYSFSLHQFSLSKFFKVILHLWLTCSILKWFVFDSIVLPLLRNGLVEILSLSFPRSLF